MYNQKILDIFRNPLNAGGLQGADGTGKVVDEKTGDVAKIYIKVENDKIVESRFKTMGSVASIVCSSVVTELVSNKTVEEAKQLKPSDIVEVVGVIDEDKFYATSLSLDALFDAINDYQKKKEKEEKEQKKSK